jgi:hypothetical protein
MKGLDQICPILFWKNDPYNLTRNGWSEFILKLKMHSLALRSTDLLSIALISAKSQLSLLNWYWFGTSLVPIWFFLQYISERKWKLLEILSSAAELEKSRSFPVFGIAQDIAKNICEIAKQSMSSSDRNFHGEKLWRFPGYFIWLYLHLFWSPSFYWSESVSVDKVLLKFNLLV